GRVGLSSARRLRSRQGDESLSGPAGKTERDSGRAFGRLVANQDAARRLVSRRLGAVARDHTGTAARDPLRSRRPAFLRNHGDRVIVRTGIFTGGLGDGPESSGYQR